MAAEDSGSGQALLDALDTVIAIRSFSDTSWRFTCPFGRYENAPKSLASRLGATGVKRHVYTFPGGNMPQWCVNRVFEEITRGETRAVLLAGGEALSTQKAAQRAKVELDWNEASDDKPTQWGVETRGWNDIEDRHRMAGAIFSYPLFENGIRAFTGAPSTNISGRWGSCFRGLRLSRHRTLSPIDAMVLPLSKLRR